MRLNDEYYALLKQEIVGDLSESLDELISSAVGVADSVAALDADNLKNDILQDVTDVADDIRDLGETE